MNSLLSEIAEDIDKLISLRDSYHAAAQSWRSGEGNPDTFSAAFIGMEGRYQDIGRSSPTKRSETLSPRITISFPTKRSKRWRQSRNN